MLEEWSKVQNKPHYRGRSLLEKSRSISMMQDGWVSGCTNSSDPMKSFFLKDDRIEVTVTILNLNCWTNLFSRERSMTDQPQVASQVPSMRALCLLYKLWRLISVNSRMLIKTNWDELRENVGQPDQKWKFRMATTQISMHEKLYIFVSTC